MNAIQFHGPTKFAEVIKAAADYASVEIDQLNQQYFILLIITDGVIADLEDTTNQIVLASSLPLSIIIVGVGNEDFTQMHYLDADDKPLYSKLYRKKMERDIVQFVPFKDFKGNKQEMDK